MLENFNDDPLALDAVNLVLSECAIDGVSSLEDQNNLDVVNAVNCLSTALRSVLSKGFSFNTFSTTYQPDMDGYIKWPSSVYSVKAVDGTRLLNQAGYVVKPDEGFTPIFTAPLEVTLIAELPPSSLPAPVWDYIVFRAAELMNDRWITSDVVGVNINKHLTESWVSFRQWWIDDEDASVFDGSAVQNLMGRT
ncbi:hypothetical protein [Chromobacterium haemolyticum]|uniref:hypothetical protein n=1 Tax=Chromobacterium haemolyticum TaxID=394935 RepID=UPI0009F0DDE6|nr:hypothetical protein [Chromobacterium haemolyticum]OQS44855.1 hypothetical protein B0T39_00995 [Chromobacterium haemolyticum]